ncbi:DUF6580 family putative transport protein [Lysobacter cavernae]|uniref:DUF6580 family putative transport protein n=1 Tax=Lysobacter cavernae TaxID=1685901 RepID=A0ABV7RTG9_9GAMM
MNRTLPTAARGTSFAPGPLVLAGLIVIAALTRLLPHPPNFSPVEAIALFGGAYFASRRWAFIVPLVGLLVSDLALAAINGGDYASWFGSGGIWLVYLCIALTTALALNLRGRVSGGRVLGYSLLGSVLFFVVTNFGAWAFQAVPLYPMTASGLAAAYVAGIPFFQWTVLGTLFYSALLFGGFALLRQRLPVLRAQTV